ncbi:hypothetical protein NDU88_001204 [Pleurodeles waltl]|uniref:XK-related protein n=2 Tax=Pleurodeles waltl TaxID=8319 RepID=A0AAV7UU41_PLEWA|nr:hypothetical protein NDU88_001204 [Pleurodeles waltl]
MAAKSDGLLKMKKSDVAFTPLQNSEHSGSVQGLAGPALPGDGEAAGASPGCSEAGGGCCGGGGGAGGEVRGPAPSASLCLRPGGGRRRYSPWDCLWVLAAALVYLADVGTDVWLSLDYYRRGQRWWFGLTLFFVALGSLSVQLFSFRWFASDFSTEDSGQQQQPGEGAKAAAGEEPVRPATPQRQASTASKGAPAVPTARGRSTSCAFCIWLMQSLVHILQLGQLWR